MFGYERLCEELSSGISRDNPSGDPHWIVLPTNRVLFAITFDSPSGRTPATITLFLKMLPAFIYDQKLTVKICCCFFYHGEQHILVSNDCNRYI